MIEPPQLVWTTFPAAGVVSVRSQTTEPSVAVAPFQCSCCCDRQVVIGIASPNGAIAVGVSLHAALDFAEKIIETAACLNGGPADGSVN